MSAFHSSILCYQTILGANNLRSTPSLHSMNLLSAVKHFLESSMPFLFTYDLPAGNINVALFGQNWWGQGCQVAYNYVYISIY